MKYLESEVIMRRGAQPRILRRGLGPTWARCSSLTCATDYTLLSYLALWFRCEANRVRRARTNMLLARRASSLFLRSPPPMSRLAVSPMARHAQRPLCMLNDHLQVDAVCREFSCKVHGEKGAVDLDDVYQESECATSRERFPASALCIPMPAVMCHHRGHATHDTPPFPV